METTNGLTKRIAALESPVPVALCRTCTARPTLTLVEPGEPARPCPECGREPFASWIDIDAASGREGAAA